METAAVSPQQPPPLLGLDVLAPRGKRVFADPLSAKATELMMLRKQDASSVIFLSLPQLAEKGSFTLI